MIISGDYLNLSLADEHVDGVTIPTKVIEYNQNFIQADALIRLKYSNQIKLNYNDIYYTNILNCYNILYLLLWKLINPHIEIIKYCCKN
jgi:hypothetical protein